MEKKLTNSGPLREPADKHSIYTIEKGKPLNFRCACHGRSPAQNRSISRNERSDTFDPYIKSIWSSNVQIQLPVFRSAATQTPKKSGGQRRTRQGILGPVVRERVTRRQPTGPCGYTSLGGKIHGPALPSDHFGVRGVIVLMSCWA